MTYDDALFHEVRMGYFCDLCGNFATFSFFAFHVSPDHAVKSKLERSDWHVLTDGRVSCPDCWDKIIKSLDARMKK